MNPTPPNPKPTKPTQTHSLNSVLCVIEGPGDTTRRPRRKHIPLPPPDDQTPPSTPNQSPEEKK